MYLLKRDWKLDIDNYDIPRSEDIGVIDYGVEYFKSYKDVLSVVNEIYFRLSSRSINAELYEAIGGIVEKLNNLAYFQYDKDLKNEDTLVEDYLGLFDTFKYRKLSEFNISTNIEVHKVKCISDEVVTQLEDSYKASFKEEYADIRDTYKDFYIGSLDDKSGSYPLISCHGDTKVLSILPNISDDTVLEGLLEVFRVICRLDRDSLYLEKYYRFYMTRRRVHNEIIHIINRLLMCLNYIFNSTSFRENEYYIFDRFEVERRTDISIEETLSYIKNLILAEIDYVVSEYK